MKKTIQYKKLCLLVFAFVFLVCIPQYGEDLKDRPDSIRYILGINVDDSTIEELPGDSITGFRLYTMEERSSVVWNIGKNYYVYSSRTGDHQLKALELFEQLQKNGIATFVAMRDAKSVRFHKYRKVIAIHIHKRKNETRP